MSNEKRKLAAILFADIQGYTALMQNDEKHAFKLVEQFNAHINAEVPNYRGQIIQFYGDGVLALFDSTMDAVNCSLALQKKFGRGSDIPVRIGLNNGEVIFSEDNAFGDSINLASRIESIGIPGSILFSENIHDQIQNKPDFEFKLVGKFQFKNIKKKTNVYGLTNDGLPVPEKSAVTGKLETKKPISLWKIVSFGIIILAGGIFITLKYFSSPIIEGPAVHQQWLGTWNQTVEGTGGPILGVLQFADSLGILKGISKNEYGPSLTSTNRLYDILINEDGSTINGKYKFDLLRNQDGNLLEGSFYFQLAEDRRSFVGEYSEKGKTAKYYWNGSRE